MYNISKNQPPTLNISGERGFPFLDFEKGQFHACFLSKFNERVKIWYADLVNVPNAPFENFDSSNPLYALKDPKKVEVCNVDLVGILNVPYNSESSVQ